MNYRPEVFAYLGTGDQIWGLMYREGMTLYGSYVGTLEKTFIDPECGK